MITLDERRLVQGAQRFGFNEQERHAANQCTLTDASSIPFHSAELSEVC
jgi:hypothetical protein